MRTNRLPRRLLCILLFVIMEAPLVAANHQGGMLPEADPEVHPPTTGVPIVDTARHDILARQADAIRSLNAYLTSQGVPPESLVPELPANVFNDRVHPGGRVGGLGPWRWSHENTWRVQSGDVNGTYWTMTDADTGKYGTMDAMLVLPAIDLSAYPLQTGSAPFINQGYPLNSRETFLAACQREVTVVRVDTTPMCVSISPLVPAVGIVQDQINLILRHQYNLFVGRDGAQVYLYERDPLQSDAKGVLLTPQIGRYSSNVVAFRDTGTGTSGYTGHMPWTNESFDLTPWAGKKIWIAFRVATTGQASADPEYFSSANFPHAGDYGWQIDDIEVVSPAYPNNLKVTSIVGPTFREDPDAPRILAPGTELAVGAEILNAAASARLARATIRVEGLAEPLERSFVANLSPGEVWYPNLTVQVPASGTVRVFAFATNPGPANTTLVDPTLDDNDLDASFEVRAVPRVDARVRPSSIMVDDGEPLTARADVENTGNVPLVAEVRLTEAIGPEDNATYRPVGSKNVTLGVGENVTLTWSLPASPRGEHRILLNVTDPLLGTVTTRAAYYVHAAPPPVFNATSWPPSAEWNASNPSFPSPPEDEWVWVARSNTRVAPVLRAMPTPEAIQAGGRFTDLRLTVRYMAVRNIFDTDLVLQHPMPVNGARTPLSDNVRVSGVTFWEMSLPRSGSMRPGPVSGDLGLGWRYLDIPIDPLASRGYPGVWSSAGPELTITAGVALQDITDVSRFYLDDLRITGVPVGGDPSQRIDIVRVTGAEAYPADGAVRPPTETLAAGVVSPAQPSLCPGETSTSAETPNCWRPMHKSAFEPRAYQDLHWRNRTDAGLPLTFPDGGPAVYGYLHSTGGQTGRPPERLVTPVFRFSEVVQPRIDLETLYAFPGSPEDYNGQLPQHQIHQVGLVLLQYRRDDGEWSDFIRIEPDTGYHSTIENTPGPNPFPRTPRTAGTGYRGTDGLHHPSRCVLNQPNSCDAGGYHLNRGPSGKNTWYDFGPYRWERLTFSLNQDALSHVNLSNREVRLGFHASTAYGTNCPHACETTWLIRDVRVTPVNVFAVDGKVENLTLNVPYDWKTIGIGPGTIVPVNVTVRNVGTYPERFQVNLTVGLHGGGEIESILVDAGQLAAGEARSLIVPWSVPLGERRFYVLNATIQPQGAADEKPFDDKAWLGLDGSLRAETRTDAAIQGAVHPTRGRESLARRTPITLFNLGNVPLTDVRVTLTVERQEVGRSDIVDQTTWRLMEPLPPNPKGVDIQQLSVQPEIAVTDLYFTPGTTGDYRATFHVETPSLADKSPDNNFATVPFVAAEPLFAEDFEEPVRWPTNEPDLWGEGPGFNSPRGLLAANRTSGVVPPETDTWIVTPPVPLSRAMGAVVNAFIKYDLEKGYDGVRLEVSKDGDTWIPVDPTDDRGLRAPYPETLVPSSPLSTGPADRPGAYSGDSRTVPHQVDGWTPVSFDLQDVPELRESVSFRDLRAPESALGESLIDLGGGSHASPSMIIDPSSETARWEIQNLTEGFAGPTTTFWWSGYSSATATRTSVWLEREFNVSDAGNEDRVVLSWWDWRAGTVGSSWKGTSGQYIVKVEQKDLNEQWFDVAGDLEVGEPVNGWYPMRVAMRPEVFNATYPLRVQFVHESREARASNAGWAIDEITLVTERVADGVLSYPTRYTDVDEAADAENWTSFLWSRVGTLPQRPSPWTVANLTAADGLQRPLWRADIQPGAHANSDSRLVTPSVDLSEVGGTRVGLRLTHAYDLAHQEGAIGGDLGIGQMKSYRAGTVEVQVLNRTTGQWDPWKQLFTPGKTPSEALSPRPAHGNAKEGAPYPATLVESGDTFQRYLRSFEQSMAPQNGPGAAITYLREFIANVSYAYAGASPKAGYMEDEFDLTPYAGQTVRFGFHAYAGAVDPENRARHWTIDNVQVIGYVLSTPDVQLRWRLATDASLLTGEFGVDQMEVSGRQYARSLGIQLDPVPGVVEPNGNIIVSGNITNYGPETRRLVAVGIRESLAPNSPFRLVIPLTAQPGGGAAGHAGVSGPFDLAPAGQDGSTVPFSFNVGVAGHANAKHALTVEVLEGRVEGGGIVYRSPPDDVPGRARRSMVLVTADRTEGVVTGVDFAPTTRSTPGRVTLAGTGLNTGTRELNVTMESQWTLPNGSQLPATTVFVGKVRPGDAFAFTMPAIHLPVEGNYTVRVNGTSIPERITYYRVARSDVNLSYGFDGTLAGWSTDSPLFKLTNDDAPLGSASVVFGYNNTQFIDQKESLMDEWGNLTSPPLDLRTTTKDRNVSFWHKPLFRTGMVEVFLERLRPTDLAPDPACSGSNALRLAQLGGREDRWQLVSLPVTGWPGCDVNASRFQVRFQVREAQGQGWRLDGFTVGSGALRLTQAADRYVITDSAVKEYPIIIHNPGHVPKDVELGVDPLLSRLSASQLKWLTLTPRSIRIEPGANATATLRVETPAARGAFPQNLDVVLAATDLAAPYAPAALRLHLDFRPLPRQDLQVAASVDGTPLGATRVELEEAVPHEVSVVLTNQGVQASGPTDVRMEIVEDRTGRVLWTQTRAIPGLDPYAETEAAFVVSGSWKPAFGGRGNHTLRVVVDPDRRFVDYDRSNDDVSLPLEVVRLIRPDLGIDAKSFGVTTPSGVPVYEAVPGQLVRISAAVTNGGYADARDVTLRILAGASVLKEEVVPLLRPGETHLLRANQFAPNATVVYRVLAFTPDLELLSDNNERTLELPVFPAEVRIDAAGVDGMEPGTTRVVNVTVADDGPYPLILRLDVKGDAPLARLDRAQLALGPGEERELSLRVTAAPDERAGTHLLVVRALDDDGQVRAQRTIPIRVAERPAAVLLPHVARGPPTGLLVQLDAVNTGNVALDGAVVVKAADGTELARAPVEGLLQGRRDLVTLKAALPPTTPPGRIAATLEVVRQDATLARVPIDLDVLPWSELDVKATPREDGSYDVRVEHRGNAPATRDVVVLDVPTGVDVRPSESRLTLTPGGAADFRVHVAQGDDALNGLYRLQVAFVDPAPVDVAAQPHLQPLTLDLRAAKVAVGEVRRDPVTPGEGETVTFRVLVRNDGAKDAEGAPVELYVDGLLMDRVEVSDLPPGQTTTVELTWKALPGAHGIVVAIDAHGPLGKGAAAYTERVEVAASIVPGASVARDLPLPPLGWLLLALAAIALARRRTN